MIKAILFDVGGVYSWGSINNFLKEAYKILKINNVNYVDEQIVFDEDYNRGMISAEECFIKYFNAPITEKQMKKIKKIWVKNWEPAHEMVLLAKRLKKHYQLAILSNSDPLVVKKYKRNGWYDIFSYLILSHEHGILKPEGKIYKIALDKLRISPEKCLFIDDQEKCLETAKEMGMKIILFKSIYQLKEDLKIMGVKF